MRAKTKMRRAEAKRANQEAALLKEQTRTQQAVRAQAEAAARGGRRATRRGGAADAPAPPTGQGVDVVASLERLAALRDSGALTTEEYEAAKAQVLGGDLPSGA